MNTRAHPTTVQACRQAKAAREEGVSEHTRVRDRLNRPAELEVDGSGSTASIRRGDVAKPVVKQRLQAIVDHGPEVSWVRPELIYE